MKLGPAPKRAFAVILLVAIASAVIAYRLWRDPPRQADGSLSGPGLAPPPETAAGHAADESARRADAPPRTAVATRFWGLGDSTVLRSIDMPEPRLEVSRDKGATWQAVAWRGGHVSAVAAAGAHWWIADLDAVHHSQDGGKTFTPISVHQGVAADPTTVRPSLETSAVGELVPDRKGRVLALTSHRILQLGERGDVRVHWHAVESSGAPTGTLVDMFVHGDHAVSVTTSDPAMLLAGQPKGGVLVSDQAGLPPSVLTGRGDLRYLRVQEHELLLAASTQPDPTIAPDSNPRGCTLFSRARGTAEWKQEPPPAIGKGLLPATLIAFADGRGKYLIGCGVGELFMADLELKFKPLEFPGLTSPRFARGTAVGDEIWFGFQSTAEHRGVAIRSDASYRYLD